MSTLLSDMLKILSQPVTQNYISHRSQGGTKISFISWSTYLVLLDTRLGLGNWQWEIMSLTNTSDHLFLVGRLHIFGSDRAIYFDSTGEEKLACNSYGDPSSNAEAMALRRCCCKAGLSRELWLK
jgi:hypothetical protein